MSIQQHFKTRHADKTTPSQYRKYYSFLLNNCVDWNNEAPTKDVRKLSKQHGSKLKQCFKNSLLIALDNDDMEYVEGFYTPWFGNLNLYPIEHAWNINTKNNLTYDTTSTLFEGGVDCRWGMVIPKPLLREYVLENSPMSPLLWFYMRSKKKNI